MEKKPRRRQKERGEEEDLLTANTLRESNGQAEQGPSIEEFSTVGEIWPDHHQSLYGK